MANTAASVRNERERENNEVDFQGHVNPWSWGILHAQSRVQDHMEMLAHVANEVTTDLAMASLSLE